MKNVLNGFNNNWPVTTVEVCVFVGADDRDWEEIHVSCSTVRDSCSGILLLFAVETPIADTGFGSWRVCSCTALQSISSGNGVYLILDSGIYDEERGEERCSCGSNSSADREFRLHVRRTLDGGCWGSC